MRSITLLIVGMVFCIAGCSKAPQEKAIVIVNAAAVDSTLLERVRAFAQHELHVPVRTVENPKLTRKKDFQTAEKAAERLKKDADVILIVLEGFNDEPRHLAVYAGSGVALVNTQPLYTNDTEKFSRRIERQVMRAAAFSIGLTPTPDPFCVTRDYTTLEDLDSMGRNFSPPWQKRFAEEAAKHGLIAVGADDK